MFDFLGLGFFAFDDALYLSRYGLFGLDCRGFVGVKVGSALVGHDVFIDDQYAIYAFRLLTLHLFKSAVRRAEMDDAFVGEVRGNDASAVNDKYLLVAVVGAAHEPYHEHHGTDHEQRSDDGCYYEAFLAHAFVEFPACYEPYLSHVPLSALENA